MTKTVVAIICNNNQKGERDSEIWFEKLKTDTQSQYTLCDGP